VGERSLWVQLRIPLLTVLVAASWLGCGRALDDVTVAEPGTSSEQLEPESEPVADDGPQSMSGSVLEPTLRRTVCNPQPAQAQLMRDSYMPPPGASPEEIERHKQVHIATVEYRSRRYGFLEGHGKPWWNEHPPQHYARKTTFFGVPLVMNARVAVALACVEQHIKQECSDTPYAVRLLSGMRLRESYGDGEISNHRFGTAIDINPDENPCCGCAPPLSEWPICKRPAQSPFDRAKIPRCWVESFERYGFYWLGRDEMQDTMHFEFLGDPDKILSES